MSTEVVVEGRRRLLRAAVFGGIGSRGREPAHRGWAQEREYDRDGPVAEPLEESVAEGRPPTCEIYRSDQGDAAG